LSCIGDDGSGRATKELLPGRSDPSSETRSTGRRPTAAGLACGLGDAGMPKKMKNEK